MIDLVLDDLRGETSECGMTLAELAIRIRHLDALEADRAALAFEGQTAFGGVVGAVFRSDRRVEHYEDATAEILVHECNDALRDADHVCGHADAAIAMCVERVLEILCDGKILGRIERLRRRLAQKRNGRHDFALHVMFPLAGSFAGLPTLYGVIPYLLSGTAIAVAWRAMLDPNFGMPSKMRWLFGDGNIFGNASSAIAVLVFVSLWQFTPFHALLYQGAVRAIPKTLYEAASIDGAGRIRQFFCITIPQVRNTLITSLLFQVVGGLTAFDAILVLTKGGPGTDTQNTAYYMYSTAFKAYNYGYSSVIAVVLIVIATILSLVMVKVSGYDKMRSELEGI